MINMEIQVLKQLVITEDITEREFVEKTKEFWVVLTASGDVGMEYLMLDQLLEESFIAYLKPNYRVSGMHHIKNAKGTYHIPFESPVLQDKIEYVWSPLRLLITERELKIDENLKVENFDVLLGDTNEFFRGYSRADYGYLMEYKQFELSGFSVAVQLSNKVVRVMPWSQLEPGIGLKIPQTIHNIALPL